ncbi:hypothetical protein [Thalassotalea marina]|uniref:Uncharacterized protein n=1 Tax=Thalassotalea marina TaxID=1673741 RepID=A0A919BRS5_9GAMM|nr:hypothetical protein [Thalassotalea marina]GHG06407.1 hypothetical protein GCM10017161_40060 [Thalassotalea marina]
MNKEKYKEIKLPNLMILHWVLNPGLAFNELILGQRLPKVMLIDQTSDEPLMERQYLPCPHCQAIHATARWSKQASFQNWFGIICPSCEKTIPCLWNLTSLIILAITFPIWGWFKHPMQARWKKFKLRQYANMKPFENAKAKEVSWLKMGLLFGVCMFVFAAIPLSITDNLAGHSLLTIGIGCTIAGLLFGSMMKLVLGTKSSW